MPAFDAGGKRSENDDVQDGYEAGETNLPVAEPAVIDPALLL